MKPLLLLAGLLLAAGPASAQAPRLQALPVASGAAPAAPTAPDTLAAIHRLFAARRQRRNLLALGAVGVAAVGTAATPTSPDRLFTTGDYAKLYGIGAAAIVLVDFVLGDEYSRKSEQRAVASFEAHRLSRHLTRRLKGRYFR